MRGGEIMKKTQNWWKILCILVLLLTIIVFVAACTEEEADEEKVPRVETREKETIGTTPSNPSAGSKSSDSINAGACDDNSKCAQGEKCVEGSCQTVNSLYAANCAKKCSLKQVTIVTNDGETVTLKPGEGNYAYAGAMGFDLLKTPQYCPGENIVVPLELQKVTTGKVLNTQVITMTKGEKSKIITHPTIKRVQFTLEVKDVKEECE